MAAQRESAFIDVTRAGLTLAAALGLTRVFDGGAWVWAIALAALVPAAIMRFASTRHWSSFVAFGVAVVVGVWLAVVIDSPSETFFGIPSGNAFSTFGHDIGRSAHILRSATVPVPPVAGALLLAFVATYVVALMTELIARRLDAPIGAIGPSVALYVAIAALGSHSWWKVTAFYAIVVIAYLIALQYGEMSARRTWFQSGKARRSHLVTGGIVGGAIVVMCAVAIGPSFPGARGSALIKYRNLGAGKGGSLLKASNPLVSIKQKLNQDKDKEIFTVNSERAPYNWRVNALDDFDGDGNWTRSQRESVSHLPEPPKIAGLTTRQVHQSVRIVAEEDANWLPAVYRPVRINLSNTQVLPESSSILVNRPIAGVAYDVDSEVPIPTDNQLRSVAPDQLRSMHDETKYPDNVSAAVKRTAHQITDKAPTPFDKAVALESYFQSNAFTYDQTVDLSSSSSAVDEFLRTKRGFCAQYAAAFAEMGRIVGLPTRMAIGYQHGDLGSDGLFHVKGEDAHAWPEVWFGPDYGWYPFEPTKNRIDPVTGRGDPNAQTPEETPTSATTPTTKSNTGTTVGGIKPTVPQKPNDIQVDAPSKHRTTGQRVAVGVVLALVALVLAGVTFVGLMIWNALRRTRRRRHDPDPRLRVLGAWSEALERLAAAGVAPHPSATSIEFALRYAPAHGAGAAGPPLMDLARLHTAAMFAPEPPSAADADDAWQQLDTIVDALNSSVTRSARWSARLRRPPADPKLN
jgi:transglutaminase-like putative cysteine protease